MNLTVKLFATFRVGRFEIADKEYPSGTCVLDIVNDLKLPYEELGVVLVNGRHQELEYQPVQGDVVAIFPVVGGG